jgi:S1-C subfamily serine protease
MKQRLLILTLWLFVSLLSFGQQQEKIYYNSDWKVCSKSSAEYYRLITLDDNGKPIGKVKDYYISGKLQWEGYFSYVDKYDNSKDVNEGLCTWYYENGSKSRESNMVNNLEDGLTTFWYSNGKIASEREYSMGIANGRWVDYRKSGNIWQEFYFLDGKLADKYYNEYDDLGNCQRIFNEAFYNAENPNEWPIIKAENYKITFKERQGLLLSGSTDQGFKSTIYLRMDVENDFSIESDMSFVKGSENSGHGIIWGFKDWDNYFYFNISANGYYRIGGRMEGIIIELAKWTKSDFINTGNSINRIKFFMVEHEMYFAINGRVVHQDSFYKFSGNQVGFHFSSGAKEVLFKNLIVKQGICKSESSTTQNVFDKDSWLGNGTGFFIDKNGYIATNYHVVEEANEIEIEFARNGIKQTFPAKVIQSDRQNDISIIKINSAEFKSFDNLPYNFKTNISDVGSNIFALGYPMALSLMGTEIKFTDGKISSKTGIQGDITTYQISVPIQPGNSGGPLFDYDGNLIGITSSGINRKLDITENANYAIKSSYLKNLVDVLDYKLALPNDVLIANKTLTEKIKILSDYVVLIKIK